VKQTSASEPMSEWAHAQYPYILRIYEYYFNNKIALFLRPVVAL